MGQEDEKEGHTFFISFVGNGQEELWWSEEGGCRSNGEGYLPPLEGAVDDRSLLSVAPWSLLLMLLSSVVLSPLLSTLSSSIKPSPSCRQDHPPPFSSPRTPGYPLDGNGGNVNHPGFNCKENLHSGRCLLQPATNNGPFVARREGGAGN